MSKKDLVEKLVDDAMSVLCFDWDWDNEDIPEVKTTRAELRNRFNCTIKKMPKGD